MARSCRGWQGPGLSWRGSRAFDVDAVDPAFAPGTGTPVPGGLTSREALQLVRALAGVALAGMDVVEVCPPLDHADVTSHLAAHVLFEGLALAAVIRGPA
ncbi:arginase family protein [Anaeromyxobacter diazotrophicus]|uniref:arginase family protein n=1 Tax=Anaeromyxobacter diazotrophicus TaxID=2590199 RepID=UPI001F33173E|nr:arginase family protein [Anaeromyxobacter diazotrophicus]